LAHGFENAAFELGQLIEKQDAMVRERDFAGSWIDVAAEEPGVTRGWQRCLLVT